MSPVCAADTKKLRERSAKQSSNHFLRMSRPGKNNRAAQKRAKAREQNEPVSPQLGRFLLQRLRRNSAPAKNQQPDLTEIKLHDRSFIIKSDFGDFASNAGAYPVHALANALACYGSEPKSCWATRFLPAGMNLGREVGEVPGTIGNACRTLNLTWHGEQLKTLDGITQPLFASYMLAEAVSDCRYVPQNIKPNDRILLTASLATAATALIARENEAALAKAFDLRFAQRCQRLFNENDLSLLPAAKIAWEIKGVHAMYDLFETCLATALHTLVDANALDVEIDLAQIDLLPEAKVVCEYFGLAPIGLIAPGALVVAGEPDACEALLDKYRLAKIPAKIIGQVLKTGEGRWLVEGAERTRLPHYHSDELLRFFDEMLVAAPLPPEIPA